MEHILRGRKLTEYILKMGKLPQNVQWSQCNSEQRTLLSRMRREELENIKRTYIRTNA